MPCAISRSLMRLVEDGHIAYEDAEKVLTALLTPNRLGPLFPSKPGLI